jgi:hypothetical protein
LALLSLPYRIVAVIAGSEPGVELADKLSHRLRLRTNGEELSAARRNKYLMGEAVRAAGIRAVKQQVKSQEESRSVYFIWITTCFVLLDML